jgi:hypothetical protein
MRSHPVPVKKSVGLLRSCLRNDRWGASGVGTVDGAGMGMARRWGVTL